MERTMAELDWEKLKILVVEDNRYFASLILTILRSVGVQNAEVCRSTDDAFDALRHVDPDVAVVDYRMAGIDGIEFVRTLRQGGTNPFLPVVMMTVEGRPAVLRAAVDAGINHFLVKPVAPKDLLGAIARVLLRPQPFVRSTDYFGPDRRRPARGPYGGAERRRRARRHASPGTGSQASP